MYSEERKEESEGDRVKEGARLISEGEGREAEKKKHSMEDQGQARRKKKL